MIMKQSNYDNQILHKSIECTNAIGLKTFDSQVI